MSTAPDPLALGQSLAATMPPVTGGSAAPAATPPPPPAAESAPADAAPLSPEVDSGGRPFDPARHVPKKNPKTGRWMPRSPGRSGRLGSASSPSSSSAQSAHGGTPPAEPSPSAPTASYIPTDIPEQPASAAAPGAGAPAAPALPVDPVASPEAVAEVYCRGLYSTFGTLTGAPEEAEPTAKEHANLSATLAAYIAARGWQTRGGWAVLLEILGYLFRTGAKPRTRERVAVWWSKLRAPKQAAPRPVAPAAPASPANPAPAAAAPSVGSPEVIASPASLSAELSALAKFTR